ncbi:ABC transporter substrate-binding protein [Paenibacillus thalictri]|uniref:Extracellular solute-binding protein n=1 Tax=Paenibacillus thalictri TaxID=2527873 RepID=A0A4Q9DWB3_9BACL|nr:extracellular solute-binding protein [Paenibacillus thalictri]TBL81367.1 extracellular solute-binding protein [Paenibacillus thalictri]
MKLKKQLAAAVSTALLSSMVLAACSQQSPAPKDGAAASAKKQPVKLKFWGGVPPESGPQEAVDAWNAQNPDIQVEYVRYVNNDEGNLKLDTALLTSQDVDLFVNYRLPQYKKRIEAGMIYDISQYKDFDIEGKMGPSAKEYVYNGKYFGVPTVLDLKYVMLNKDLLDAAGLPVPFDWTWDDMKQYANKLKQDKRWGLVQFDYVLYDPIDGSLDSLGFTKSDNTSNFDHPYVKQHLQTLHDMMLKDKSTPTLVEQLTTKMPVDTVFLKGEAGILNAGYWVFRNSNDLKNFPRNFKIAFAPVPRLSKDQKDFKILGGVADTLCISSKTKYPEEAWKFIKWYADGGMLPMAKGGRIPASKDINMDQVLKLLMGDAEKTYDVESFKKVLADTTPRYQLKIEQQVVDLRNEEMEKFFGGNKTLDQAVNDMVKRHNDFLKQQKK